MNEPSKRHWLRLHISSLFAMLIPLACWVLIAIPGQHIKYRWSVLDSWEHGWPAIHLIRVPKGMRGFHPKDGEISWSQSRRGANNPKLRFWSDPEGWSHTIENGTETWYPRAAMLNVGVLILGCLIVGGALELRRRRRNSLFQISITDLLVLTAIIALPFAYFPYQLDVAKQRENVFRKLENREDVQIKITTQPPIWADRLCDFASEQFPFPQFNWPIFGKKPFETETAKFLVSSSVSFSTTKDVAIQDLEQTVKDLRYTLCDRVLFGRSDRSVVLLLNRVRKSRFKELQFGRAKDQASVEIIQALRGFNRLGTLSLSRLDLRNLDNVDFELPRLKKLTVLNNQIDQTTIDWILRQKNLDELFLSFDAEALVEAKPKFKIYNRQKHLMIWDGKQRVTRD
jgi:hypothetical protein